MKSVKLGNYIERILNRNNDLNYESEDVRGISNTKEIVPTKADLNGRSLNRFLILPPEGFVFNRRTDRMGGKLGLGYNDTDREFLFTEDYVAFRISEDKREYLLPAYLNIFFRRDEFDRYVRYDSWGSAAQFFNWEEMCDVPIILPPVPIQQKYVDVYNAMHANQRTYESGLEDLKLTYDSYIEQLRREMPHTAIREYLELCDEKNTALTYDVDSVKGVSIEKRFIETKADMDGVSLKPYLLVEPDTFAFVTVTSRNGEKISLAHNDSDDTYLCSSSYVVFRVSNKEKLISSYLRMFFSRSEFDRYTRFHSWGSA